MMMTTNKQKMMMMNNKYQDVDGSPGTNWEQSGQGPVFNQLEFDFSREFTFFFTFLTRR